MNVNVAKRLTPTKDIHQEWEIVSVTVKKNDMNKSIFMAKNDNKHGGCPKQKLHRNFEKGQLLRNN